MGACPRQRLLADPVHESSGVGVVGFFFPTASTDDVFLFFIFISFPLWHFFRLNGGFFRLKGGFFRLNGGFLRLNPGFLRLTFCNTE